MLCIYYYTDLLCCARSNVARGSKFLKGPNMENIEAKVKKVVADKLGIDEATIKDDASFIEDLGADSLDTVELVMALEEEFGCEIPDEEAEKITTVQKAIDYIKANI